MRYSEGVLSNMLLREARLRSGLSQKELGARVGVPGNVISRWELGRVALGFDRLVELIRACGLDLAVELVPLDDDELSLVVGYLGLTPQRRLSVLTRDVRQNAELFGEEAPVFEPLVALRELHAAEVDFIVVGGVAATLHGSPYPTYGLDITPEPSDENGARLVRAVQLLGVDELVEDEDVARYEAKAGPLSVVRQPAGTFGYHDLARSAETMNVGVRVRVASLADVIRSADALARPEHRAVVKLLRRLATELPATTSPLPPSQRADPIPTTALAGSAPADRRSGGADGASH